MIYFQQVTKSFGSFTVLNDLTLHIPKGKITFIIGKSGEGKSVTIKHMMGLLQPNKGRVIVDQEWVGAKNETQLRVYRQKFGMLFQHAALFDSLTVEQNILFPLDEWRGTQMTPQGKKLRTQEVLAQVALEGVADKFPHELSTGEKKRVGLARALAPKPKILLYDEPTTGMDPLVCEMIDHLIVQLNHQETEMTSVVISHDLKAALDTADQIIMLYKGQVALAGPPSVFNASDNPVVRQFFSGRVDGPMEFF